MPARLIRHATFPNSNNATYSLVWLHLFLQSSPFLAKTAIQSKASERVVDEVLQPHYPKTKKNSVKDEVSLFSITLHVQ